jgi:hypothetical protein
MATTTVDVKRPSIAFPQQPTKHRRPVAFDAWQRQGEELVRLYQKTDAAFEAIQWHIGDWLVQGEKKFEKKAYAEAERITGWDRNYLYNVVWVVKRFAAGSSLRKETTLKWSHFKELAWIADEQRREQVLRRVSDPISYPNAPTVRDLREIVDRERNKESANESVPKGNGRLKDLAYLRVPLTPGHCMLLKDLADAKRMDRDALLAKIVVGYLKENKSQILAVVRRAKEKRRSLRQKRRKR